MTAELSLNPEGEAAWLRVKQHLAWCDQFALVFLFSDRPGVIDLLRERLAAIYRARVTGLAILPPRTPEELLTGLLPRLLDPPQYQQALNAPVWLDLTRPVARTGDRLAGGRSRVPGPPQRAARALAPYPEQTPDPGAVPGGQGPDQIPGPGPVGHPSLQPRYRTLARPGPPKPPAHPEPFSLSDTERVLVREWRRLQDKGSIERGALLAGARAWESLLRRGHIDEAKEAATWLATTARSRLADKPEDPESLRDLSVSLNNLGNTDQALGDRQQARNAFTEGLEIAQRLATALPEHEDYKNLPDRFERRLAESGEGPRLNRKGELWGQYIYLTGFEPGCHALRSVYCSHNRHCFRE